MNDVSDYIFVRILIFCMRFHESIAIAYFFSFFLLSSQELGAARSAKPVAQAPSAADADARGVPS